MKTNKEFDAVKKMRDIRDKHLHDFRKLMNELKLKNAKRKIRSIPVKKDF